jgi:hypothetical protein
MHTAGERGLRQRQMPCGTSQAAPIGNGDHVAKLVQLHLRTDIKKASLIRF